MKPIDVEMVKSRLDYDPNTGTFTWKSGFHKSRIGTLAGTINRRVYVVIEIGVRIYAAARAFETRAMP